MPEPRDTPDALACARRTLDGLSGTTLLGDWEWNGAASRWTLRCRLHIDHEGNGIAAESEWVVLATEQYPWGTLKLMPAITGGITGTYEHQSYNGKTGISGPWRSGDICLNTSVNVLRRTGFNIEPYTIDDRLAWHVERARDWLSAAAAGRLSVPGDPFELPQFPDEERNHFAFCEGAASFAMWQQADARSGAVDFSRHEPRREYLVAHRYQEMSGAVVFEPSWGERLAKSKVFGRGLWIRLERPPILSPWQAPATWGELRAACQAQELNLDTVLKSLLLAYRKDRPSVLLVGFPIPREVGGEDVQYHWQAVRLPRLAGNQTKVAGFRPGSTGQWVHDRTGPLRDAAALSWMQSENWDMDEICTRGRLPVELRDSQVLVIGAGALGAPIAELLVRGGVQSVVIVDEGEIEIGNLVRHTASMDNLSGRKAHVLADRLRKLSPHVSAHAVYASFPLLLPDDEVRAKKSQIVIDCTAEDALIPVLEEYQWEAEAILFSFSLGMEARRLFCYHAPANSFSETGFREALSPWLLAESEAYRDIDLPREGVGCWHPVFPARADDIWLMAALAVKEVERVLRKSGLSGGLTVYEQERDTDGDPVGVRRITS